MSDEVKAHRRGMGFAAASFLSSAVLTTLSAVVTARIYGIDVIGEFALVSAAYLMVSRLSATGEQTAMVNRLAVLGRRTDLGSAIFVSVLGFSYAITSLIAGIVTFVSVLLLRGPIDRPDLVRASIIMVIVYVAIENYSWNLDAALSALHGAGDMFVARMIQALGFLGAAVWFGSRDPEVEGLVTAYIVSVGLAAVWRTLRVRRYLSRPNREAMPDGLRELPAILRFGVRLIPGTLAHGIASQVPIWLLGATQTEALLGGYSRAANLSARLEEAGFRTYEITYPELVRAHAERSSDRLNEAIRDSLRPLLLGLALIIGVVAGAAEGIMEVFGEGFDEASGALVFLVIASSVYAWTIVVMSMLPAFDRPGLGAVIATGRSVLIVAVVFPAAIYGGITTTAAAIAAAFAVSLLVAWIVVVRLAAGFGYELTRPFDFRLFIPTVACAAVAYAIDSASGGFLALMVAGLAATITYVVVAVGVGVVPREWIRRATGLVRSRLSRSTVG